MFHSGIFDVVSPSTCYTMSHRFDVSLSQLGLLYLLLLTKFLNLTALNRKGFHVTVYVISQEKYSKTCVKRPLSKRPKNGFQH